jgi:hypothetical protein
VVPVRRALPLLLVAGVAAGEVVPRGALEKRPVPTHVVVSDTVLAITPSLKATVAAGTPVAVSGGTVGQVTARTLGDVELTGKLDGGSLALVVLRDVDVTTADGREPLGQALTGSWVRPAGAPSAGAVVVETVGPVRARFRIPVAALGGETRELVYPNAGRQIVTGLPADLYSTPEAKGVRAQIAAGTALWLLDEAVDKPVARVRTFGGVAIEGWVLKTKVAAGAEVPSAPVPQRETPTHEVLVGADLIADPRGGKPIGRLRGGALVAVFAGQERASLVRIRTRHPVVMVGWVAAAALRPVEASVWEDP